MARSYRNTPRISRPLIGALGVTIVLGGAIYLHRNNKPKAAGAQTVLPAAAGLKGGGAVIAPNPTVLANLNKLTGGATAGGVGPAASNSTLVTVTPTGLTNNSPGKLAADPTKSVVNPNAVSVVAGNAKPAPAVKMSAASLVEGKAKKDARDLIGARTLINGALLSGQLGESDAQAARQLLTEINQTAVFSPRVLAGDDYCKDYPVQPSDQLARIASKHTITWQFLCLMNGLPDPKKIRAGQVIKVIDGPFHAVVTKSKFRLDLYLGSPGGADSMYIASYSVGLGRDNSTPAGLWKLQQGSKAHPATYYSPRGEGVIPADDPRNPLGGYWMGIVGLEGEARGKSSYGIHGTIEPDSIGKQASMGCIRLGHEDIALLYDMLIEGKSLVMVKD